MLGVNDLLPVSVAFPIRTCGILQSEYFHIGISLGESHVKEWRFIVMFAKQILLGDGGEANNDS